MGLKSIETKNENFILIEGASQNNLKEIDVKIPKESLTVITGVSGSGKSSLAFDTLFAEGERRYLSTLSLYARQFIKQLERPKVKTIKGISPSISIEQKVITNNPRSTVGSISEAYDYLRLLFSKLSEPVCPTCGAKIKKVSPHEIAEFLIKKYRGEKVKVLAPVIRGRKGEYKKLFEETLTKGYLRALVNGKYYELELPPELDKNQHHNISILVDTILVKENSKKRIVSSINKAFELTENFFSIEINGEESVYSSKLFCPVCGTSLPEPEPRVFSYNSPYGWCKKCKGMGEIDGRVCDECGGKRLNEKALSFKINGKDIGYYSTISIDKLISELENLEFFGNSKKIAEPILSELFLILKTLKKLSLGYLTLFRGSQTLSGGESQRIRLSSQISSKLRGVTYILDEPSIGLHIRDHKRLIEILKKIRDQGNTVVVVEHEENTIKEADWILDLGPEGGEKGGKLLFQGKFEDFLKSNTLTALYLKGEKKAYSISKKKRFKNFIEIYGAKKFNLKNINLRIPLGAFVTIAGVSGSGKSTLVYEVIYKNYKRFRAKKKFLSDSVEKISGFEFIKNMVIVDQKPIGKNPRSIPATYVGVFSEIRKLFSLSKESKKLGFTMSHFSFNLPYGQCPECNGMGYKKIEMGILPPAYSQCFLCKGKRFSGEVLKVNYRGKTIADVLDMTVSEANEFFKNIAEIKNTLKFMESIGLGYIKLGQPAPTLSGGESQRLKIAKELAKGKGENTVYILDEPTTGLHFNEIKKLINCLKKLVSYGNSVIVIEHNPEFIASSEWVIELGPEGGDDGGYIIGEGEPVVVSKLSTPTGEVLRSFLNERQ